MPKYKKSKLSGHGANGAVLALKNQQAADAFAESMAPYLFAAMLRTLNKKDRTYIALAAALNERGVKSATGKKWSPAMVSHLQKRLGPTFLRLFREALTAVNKRNNKVTGLHTPVDLWRREWWNA